MSGTEVRSTASAKAAASPCAGNDSTRRRRPRSAAFRASARGTSGSGVEVWCGEPTFQIVMACGSGLCAFAVNARPNTAATVIAALYRRRCAGRLTPNLATTRLMIQPSGRGLSESPRAFPQRRGLVFEALSQFVRRNRTTAVSTIVSLASWGAAFAFPGHRGTEPQRLVDTASCGALRRRLSRHKQVHHRSRL